MKKVLAWMMWIGPAAGYWVCPLDSSGDPEAFAPFGSMNESAGGGTVSSATQPPQYTFLCQDGPHTIEYEILIGDPSVSSGMISIRVAIDEKHRLIPVYQGGLIVQSATGSLLHPADVSLQKTSRLVQHERRGHTVHLHYEEELYGQKLNKEYAFTLRGKTLVIQAAGDVIHSASASYVGFEFGRSRYTNNATILRLPACPIPVAQSNESFFFSTYADPLLSTTGRYTEQATVFNTRTIEVGNTPALLVPDASGRWPDLQVTAYLTVSSNLADVLPVPPASAVPPAPRLRERVVLDLHEWPFAHRPLTPGGLIRRWEAPVSGTVSLKGTFALLSGDLATCEVYLLEGDSGESALLFSQVLDPDSKPATGIEGNFPLEAGDQLLFACTGPAILTGGEVGLHLLLRQDGLTYNSNTDFADQQGHQGWYYEQQIGPYRTLLIWHPERKRWESPVTRSYQTAERIVTRSGSSGDAFQEAQAFFDDLDCLGLQNLTLLARSWSRHASINSPSPVSLTEQVWGSSQNLLTLTQNLLDKGNVVIPVIDPFEAMDTRPADPRISSLTSTAGAVSDNWLDRSLSAMQIHSLVANQVMHAQGALLEFPGTFGRWVKADSPYGLLGLSQPASSAAYKAMRDWTAAVRKITPGPLLMAWNDTAYRFDLYAASLFDALLIPSRTDSNALSLVEEELHVGRIHGPRIGFGTYKQYYQNPQGGNVVDLRLFPLDHYLASTLACGRVPYISSQVWFPGFDERTQRRYLLETYCLLAPAAEEYLDPANAVTNIAYQAGDDTSHSVLAIIKSGKLDQIDRIAVRYANGLRIYANHRSKPWLVHPTNTASLEISKDGFLAWNEKTGLLSMTGLQGFRPFSVCQTPRSLFLHSRDGQLTRYGSLATDGMVYRRPNAYSAFPDMTSLAASDVSALDPMIPILRSNHRVDCALRWQSPSRVELRIYHAEPSPTLLELFDLPPEWLREGSPLAVLRTGEYAEDEPPIQWYIIESNQRKGIRFTDIESGDRYAITYGEADHPKTIPGPERKSQAEPEPKPVSPPEPAQQKTPLESQLDIQPGDLLPSPLPD